MRIDKFLQTFGLIKRRVLAHEACTRQLVQVNGKACKPSHVVVLGDLIEFELPRRRVAIRIVKEIPLQNIRKIDRDTYIEIIRDEKTDSQISSGVD